MGMQTSSSSMGRVIFWGGSKWFTRIHGCICWRNLCFSMLKPAPSAWRFDGNWILPTNYCPGTATGAIEMIGAPAVHICARNDKQSKTNFTYTTKKRDLATSCNLVCWALSKSSNKYIPSGLNQTWISNLSFQPIPFFKAKRPSRLWGSHLKALDDGRCQLGRARQCFGVLLGYHQCQGEEIPIALGIRKSQAAAAVTCGEALQGKKKEEMKC